MKHADHPSDKPLLTIISTYILYLHTYNIYIISAAWLEVWTLGLTAARSELHMAALLADIKSSPLWACEHRQQQWAPTTASATDPPSHALCTTADQHLAINSFMASSFYSQQKSRFIPLFFFFLLNTTIGVHIAILFAPGHPRRAPCKWKCRLDTSTAPLCPSYIMLLLKTTGEDAISIFKTGWWGKRKETRKREKVLNSPSAANRAAGSSPGSECLCGCCRKMMRRVCVCVCLKDRAWPVRVLPPLQPLQQQAVVHTAPQLSSPAPPPLSKTSSDRDRLWLGEDDSLRSENPARFPGPIRFTSAWCLLFFQFPHWWK